MKNKILIGLAVLAIAAVAAWNVNLNSHKSDLSDIALANVEALAQEADTNGYNTWDCRYSSKETCNREWEEYRPGCIKPIKWKETETVCSGYGWGTICCRSSYELGSTGGCL